MKLSIMRDDAQDQECEGLRDRERWTADLTEDKDVSDDISIALLHKPDWRLRAVERIDLTSASWADRRRSIHVTPLREILGNDVHRCHTHARIVLPVGNFPRGPLLDFNLKVAEEPAFLLPRKEHSRIQAGYLAFLAEEAGIITDATTWPLKPLLMEIFNFTNGYWRRLRQPEFRKIEPSPDERKELTLKYLIEKGTRNPKLANHLSPDAIHDWTKKIDPIRRMVEERLAESIDSAASNPLLALPGFYGYLALVKESSISTLLADLRSFFLAVEAKANSVGLPPDKNPAEKLLKIYAAYGCYWDALAECTVPLDEPFIIKVAEKRGLHLGDPGENPDSSHSGPRRWMWRKTSSQLFVWADAGTNHLNVRVQDTNVELVTNDLRMLNDRLQVVSDWPEFHETTPELLAIYDSKPNRAYRVWIGFPLKTSTPATVARFVILGLTATAFAGFFFFLFHWLNAGGNKTMTGADVAVILVPSAIAASLLLVRESSTLSSEITKESSYIVALLLAALWIFTLCAYGVNKVDWGSRPEEKSTPSPTLSIKHSKE